MEEFDLGLEECVVETSPDFDESPGEPPPNKARRRKVATKKEQQRLVTEIRALSLTEISSCCLDKTRFKLTEHANQAVVEFALEFEPNEVFFVVKSLQNLFAKLYESCSKKKDKFITFKFQWHQNCSILLVKDATDLAQMKLDPADKITTTMLTARQQWVSFYQAKMVTADVAKTFMLVFLGEVFTKLLRVSQSVLAVSSDTAASNSTTGSADPVDVYYRFGGATLASMLHNRYKVMKLEHTKEKEKISQEIHILQALNTKDKHKIPKYLQYRDRGYMYFPCEELLPFLQGVDVAVKTHCNEVGFRKYGKSLVHETVKLVNSQVQHKDEFCAVLTKRLESTEYFKSTAIDDVLHEFISKLTNTRIQEFLDSFKAAAAIKKGTASVSGQNLRDSLLTHHINLKTKKK